jgi:hypothetical protein
MGNITSGQGNNKLSNDKGGYQTPLNTFIQEVMNESYFFSPNVYDNMINNLDKTDISNNKVLLKRALCTGRSHIPISLPYVECLSNGRCKSGTYTVKINATHPDGTPLPAIENIAPKSYQIALRGAIEFEKKTSDEKNKIIDAYKKGEITNSEDLDIAKLVIYRRIQEDTKDRIGSDVYNYSTTVDMDKSPARIGEASGCALFYTNNNLNYDRSNEKGNYNSTDINTGYSITKAFCGKVLQYNELAPRFNSNSDNINSFNSGNVEKIGRYSIKTNGNGNNFKDDEFRDCSCLNSDLAINHAEIDKMQNNAQRLLKQNNSNVVIDTGENIAPDTLAQNNDPYCKSNLHEFGIGSTNNAPSAYASTNKKLNRALNICSNLSLIQGVDQEGGNFEAGANCGFSQDEEQKMLNCFENKNAPGCEYLKRSSNKQNEYENNDNDDESNDNIFKRLSKRFNELPTNHKYIIYGCIFILFIFIIIIIIPSKKKSNISNINNESKPLTLNKD